MSSRRSLVLGHSGKSFRRVHSDRYYNGEVGEGVSESNVRSAATSVFRGHGLRSRTNPSRHRPSRFKCSSEWPVNRATFSAGRSLRARRATATPCGRLSCASDSGQSSCGVRPISEEIQWASMSLTEGQSLLPRGSGEDVESMGFQPRAEHVPYRLLVIHEEQGWSGVADRESRFVHSPFHRNS